MITIYLTPDIVDERQPLPHMVKKRWGKMFSDKGYISQPLFDQLFEHGIQLITPLRKNMKNRPMPLIDKDLIRK